MDTERVSERQMREKETRGERERERDKGEEKRGLLPPALLTHSPLGGPTTWLWARWHRGTSSATAAVAPANPRWKGEKWFFGGVFQVEEMEMVVDSLGGDIEIGEGGSEIGGDGKRRSSGVLVVEYGW